MRGILTFLTACFLVVVHYLVGVYLIEPLLALNQTVDLAVVGGDQTRTAIRDAYFLYGPWVYLAGWFVWAVRYYVSPNRFRGQEVRRP